MEILSNQLFVSNERVDARQMLVSAGLSRKDADKTVVATGFEELSRLPGTSVERIVKVVSGNIWRQTKGVRGDIAVVIVVTQTNDKKIPNAASLLQAELELDQTVFCLEIVEGCNGFVKALHLAHKLLKPSELALIFCGDINSNMLHGAPPGTAALFGDGFASTIVKSTAGFEGVVYQDGSSGGAIRFDSPNGSLEMDGVGVYSFTARRVPELLSSGLASSFSATRFPVFHQASQLVVDHVSRKVGASSLGIALFNANRIGNLGPASIPGWIAEHKSFTSSSELICVGFGAGLSWGFASLTWKGASNEISLL